MKYFQLLQKKINFFSKETIYSSFRQKITMAKFITFRSKTKAIQADLGIFMDIPTYSGIFITLCRYIQDPSSIFRTMVYSEPCFIQNPSIFRSLKHSEPCQASTMEYFAKILNGYNYFRNISFSRSLPCEKMCIF